MGKLLKIVLVLVAVAVALPFFLKGRDGRPLLRLAYFQPQEQVQSLVADAQGMLQTAGRMLPKPAPAPEKPATVYRWRDAEGKVHFSDRPNPHGASEAVVVNPAANNVPAASAVEPAAAGPKHAAEMPSLTPALTSVPIGQVPQMIDDARALQALAAQQETERQALLAK